MGHNKSLHNKTGPDAVAPDPVLVLRLSGDQDLTPRIRPGQQPSSADQACAYHSQWTWHQA